ncbi:MAG: hypothetical protein QOH35_2102 [Acidobacteriaceae bacterium]|jgi:hypothetical protein|nr:hypothetical protein [Acidobacteriaceae bacterium]
MFQGSEGCKFFFASGHTNSETCRTAKWPICDEPYNRVAGTLPEPNRPMAPSLPPENLIVPAIGAKRPCRLAAALLVLAPPSFLERESLHMLRKRVTA